MGIKTKCVIARPLLFFQEERQTVSYFLKNVILCFIIFKTRIRGRLALAALNTNE
jgi:hypothetical protein